MVTNPENILIIKPSSLGDVIHALPVLRVLKNKFPEARISWIINKELSELIEGSPYIDEIFLFHRKRWYNWLNLPVNLIDFTKFIFRIRKRRFDTVIDLQGLMRSGIISFLSGSSCRIGFENARELSPFFYTDKILLPDKKIHSVERYIYTAKSLGADDTERDFTIRISDEDIESVENFLKEKGVGDTKRIVVVNPWARWETKCWPIQNFLSLIERLRKEGLLPILISGNEFKEDTEELIKRFSEPPIAFLGQPLKRLTALLKRSHLLVTNDSGPMHIAAAVNTPVVALFGPTDPLLTGPYGNGHIVIQKNMDCAPCLERDCSQQHECMERITVDDVMGAVRKKLFEKETEIPDSLKDRNTQIT